MADTLRSRSSGRFWVDDPDRTVGGWIDLSGRWPVVDLAEPLTPSRREVARIERTDGSSEVHLEPADDPVEPDRITVRGLLRSTVQGARRLTLVNAFNSGRGEVWGGVVPDPGSEQLTADYALLGDHTLDASSRFNRARVRLRNLDVWAQLPGIAMELNRDEGRVTVTYERPDEETVDLAGPPGGRLVLSSVLTVRMLTVRGGGPSRTTELRWETDGDGLTIDELWAQLIDPLRVLFTLTSGALDPVVELQVAEPEGSWLKVLHPALEMSPDEPLASHAMFMTRAQVEMGNVAQWLSKAQKLSPIPQLVADLVVPPPRRPVENQVLQLATAAEGLHRRLHTTQKPMTSGQARQVRKKAAAAVDEDVREQVNQALAHLDEPTFRDRLRTLADQGKNTVPGATGNVEEWISRVVAARNGFAHQLTTKNREVEIEEYLVLTGSLRWLLTGLLLREIGVAQETFVERLHDSQTYLHFRQRAMRWLPDVYPEQALIPTNP